jgi:2-desacetyl-2-hydroxyethyl bacteriochlorophyllide A dehydrogenase
MKAAVYTKYGPPDVLQIKEVAKPVPKDNEVLVRVHATTVCTADWRVRKADPVVARLITGLWKPRNNILGMELAGTVESAGKNVTRFAAGDAVFGGTLFKFGANAEYACVGEGTLEIKPRTMTFEEAGAVFFGAVTAWHFLKQAKIQPGQKVLIYGASGSVGTFAVQLAKHLGARVTGVCSTGNLELVKSLGADEVVDYTREDFAKAGQIYDVIMDTTGKVAFARFLKTLKRGGFLALVGYSGFSAASMLRQAWASITGAAKAISGVARGTSEDMRLFRELIESGRLKTVIDRCYPLDEIAEAHRYVEKGHKKGHVVIVVGQPSR